MYIPESQKLSDVLRVYSDFVVMCNQVRPAVEDKMLQALSSKHHAGK